MKFQTVLLAAAVLSAPVPGYLDTVKGAVKNTAGAIWSGTKVATLGLVGGSAFAAGAVGTHRLLNRKSTNQETPASSIPAIPDVSNSSAPVVTEKAVVQ